MTTLDATVPPAAASPPVPPCRAPLRTRRVSSARSEPYWRLHHPRRRRLLAVTLGIYRFWLTTDMRRFLWSNTEIAGETLEYTGTARELLLGFLIAIAILIPLYAVAVRGGAQPRPDRPACRALHRLRRC